jgi:membrane fusion protein, copper/silver efflux system
MRLVQWFQAGLMVSILAIAALGCGPSTTTSDAPAGTGAPASTSANEDAEVAATLAKLSPEDRAAAERQKICPVSGEPLGSMGVPPKVMVNGRDVFICCEGCDAMLQEDPEKYLAKLPAE